MDIRSPFPSHRRLGRLLVAALALAGAACATEPPAPARATAAELMRPIETLIGDAGCDSDAQCRSIGVGHKACGGPAGYLAWSTRATDEARLKAAVERQAQAARAESQRSGRMSNCMAVADPGARCVATVRGRQCQAGDESGAAP